MIRLRSNERHLLFSRSPNKNGCCIVIADAVVIADLIRNPVLAYHWIPDVETPDLIRGRDDTY